MVIRRQYFSGSGETLRFRAVGGVDEARLAPLVKGSEALRRSLPQALQSKLRLACEIALQGSEQVSCRTFVEKAGSSYLVSLELGAHSDVALLQVDSSCISDRGQVARRQRRAQRPVAGSH